MTYYRRFHCKMCGESFQTKEIARQHLQKKHFIDVFEEWSK